MDFLREITVLTSQLSWLMQ